jgi:photosystem II stability/assembly factor-like uncharacterized protein
MRCVAYIVLFLFSISLYSQNKWELTHNDIREFPERIVVLDTNNIMILMSTFTTAHYIYHSNNQGKNWKSIYDTHLYVSAIGIECIDTNNLFLGFREGFMYHSQDGGKNMDTIRIKSLNTYDDFAIYNTEVGVITNAYIVPDTFFILVTYDRWKTYKKFHKQDDSSRLSYYLPRFKNDSIINCIVGNSRGRRGGYFCEFNINTFEYKLNWIGTRMGSYDMCIIDNKYIFMCGESDILNGGSSNDGISKSSDSGKTWRRVLDFRSDRSKFNKQYFPPFGLQSISFKDSLTGIAVGQFGKIVYTYDGGESWIYESKLHDSIDQPATMKVRYAGSVPIIADFNGQIYRMIEDNLDPKPEDTITISGRVWEGTKGQPGIPIELGFRITMTDSNGYYKFTRVSSGKHIVKAKNKYHDGDMAEYYYKPFDYTPVQYDLDLTSDTSGIDFNAIDLRTFYSVSGEIITSDGIGLKDIPLTIGDSTTVSIEEGKFIFPKIEQKRIYELIPYSKEYKFTPWAYSINIDKDLDTFRFVASPITSVEENPNNQLIISDNCKILTYITEETMNCIFDSDVNSNNFSISIFSINGELLLKELQNVVKGNNEFTINLKNINTGIYLIQAELNGICSKTDKLIIVK